MSLDMVLFLPPSPQLLVGYKTIHVFEGYSTHPAHIKQWIYSVRCTSYLETITSTVSVRGSLQTFTSKTLRWADFRYLQFVVEVA